MKKDYLEPQMSIEALESQALLTGSDASITLDITTLEAFMVLEVYGGIDEDGSHDPD